MPKVKNPDPKRRGGRYKADVLTEKEALFCEFYAADPEKNAKRAAKRAGYSQRYAAEVAWGLLRKPKVRKRVRELVAPMVQALQRKLKRTKLSGARVLEELAAVAFSDIRDYVRVKAGRVQLIDSDKWSDEAAAAMSAVRRTSNGVEVRPHAKIPALDILAKHFGLLKEEFELPPGTVAQINLYRLPEKQPFMLSESNGQGQVIETKAVTLPPKQRPVPVRTPTGRNGDERSGSADDELS